MRRPLTTVLKRMTVVGAGLALAVFGGASMSAQGRGRTGSQPGVKEGCPFKALTAKVQSVFGPYDRAMFNGGEVKGGEIPNLIKVREVTIYTCAFQRMSTQEALQIIANVYPTEAEALSAFTEASHAKSGQAAYYTSSRQVGKMQVFEGPGRSLSHVADQVVIIHWQMAQGRRFAPVNKPGSVLTPIAEVWYGPLLK
jgi:hypothetical protein